MIELILTVLYIWLGLALLTASALLITLCKLKKQIEVEREAAKQPEFWDENAV